MKRDYRERLAMRVERFSGDGQLVLLRPDLLRCFGLTQELFGQQSQVHWHGGWPAFRFAWQGVVRE